MPTLPAPFTRFVGRETELAQAVALQREARLLTLTGPGGGGKTRLALHLASAVAELFPDGVWFVDLAPLSDDQFVWDQVAMSLGVREPGSGRTLATALGRHLDAHQTLIVLDNCEHLVESAAEVASVLLSSAPSLKIISTSREPLGVDGEVTWAVPPLSDRDAVELFSDRARQAWPEFRLRDADTKTVLDICRRLEGLPLAIELAAARSRALDPAQIAAGLKDRFALLPSGPRTAPQRQSTLAASFDWSYQLLSDPERALLRQLSVFAGGFDSETALVVCPAASLELLAELADRSMIVVQDRGGPAGPRYRMLETVRQFAAEHLDEAAETDLIRARHRDHFLSLAELAVPELSGPEQDRWYARLGDEQDNMRAALVWSRDRGEAELLARMVFVLVQFWALRGRFIEAQLWLEAAAERADELSLRLRGSIRVQQSYIPILAGSGSLGEVPALANEALALTRAAGDQAAEGMALLILGMVAGMVGGAEAMRPYFEQALPLVPSFGPAQGFFQVIARASFVTLRWFQSDPEELQRLGEQAVAAATASRDRHALITALWISGVSALIRGRLVHATSLFETAVAEGRQSRDNMQPACLLGRAWVAMFRGEFAAARAAISESVSAEEELEAEGVVGGGWLGPLARWILGWMDLAGGGAAEAANTMQKVADSFRSSPLARLAAAPLVVQAEAQAALGLLDAATASIDEATSLSHAGKMTWVLGRAALVRAKLRALEGDLAQAELRVHEALSLGREAGDQFGVVDALEERARLAARQESGKAAIRLWAAAETLRTELGYRLAVDRAGMESALARCKQSLGPDDFAAAWAEGAKLSADEAVDYATRGRGERRRPATGWAGLTPSELEVARLVGQHLTNPEIARRLFVSRSTVKSHLLHIFAKLGIGSRSELAAEALRRGMQPVTGAGRSAE
jgi:predicted ATPase/DNA-binding CsgD family transcriptional regulator